MENDIDNIDNNIEVERGWGEDLKIGFLAGLFSFVIANVFLGLFFDLSIFPEFFSKIISGGGMQYFFQKFLPSLFMLIATITAPSMLGIAVGRHFFMKRGYGADSIYILPQIFPLIASLITIIFATDPSFYFFVFVFPQMPFIFCASIGVHLLCKETIQGVKMVRERKIIRWAILILFALTASLVIYGLMFSSFVYNLY